MDNQLLDRPLHHKEGMFKLKPHDGLGNDVITSFGLTIVLTFSIGSILPTRLVFDSHCPRGIPDLCDTR